MKQKADRGRIYREHRLRILRYSAKSIWLLVFPLLRGIRISRIDADRIYSWIKGAWFDIAVLAVIILFGLMRWHCSRIIITDEKIEHIEGIFFESHRVIPVKSISSFVVESPFYLRPFKAKRVFLGTNSGSAERKMKLLAGETEVCAIRKAVAESAEKSCTVCEYYPGAVLLVLYSLFFSSSLTGAVYIALFMFRGGEIARELTAVSFDRIAHETTKLTGLFIRSIPYATVLAGSFFLSAWVLSFIVNFSRYYGFRLCRKAERTEIVCGLSVKKKTEIRNEKIRCAELKQTFIMKLAKLYSVNLSCGGYPAGKRQHPVIYPVIKANRLLKLNKKSEQKITPKITSLWQYIWKPVLSGVSVCYLSAQLAEKIKELSQFTELFTLMALLWTLWGIIIGAVSLLTSYIKTDGEKVIISYAKGSIFSTVIADKSSLSEITVKATLFQRIFRKCSISLVFNGKKKNICTIKGVKYRNTERIFKALGYDLLLDSRDKK